MLSLCTFNETMAVSVYSLVSLWFSGDGDVAEISGFWRSEKVQNLPASGSSPEVRAHPMGRKLRSAGFTPLFHAELPSNGYA